MDEVEKKIRLDERIKIRRWIFKACQEATAAENIRGQEHAGLAIGLFLHVFDDSIRRRGGKIKEWQVKVDRNGKRYLE